MGDLVVYGDGQGNEYDKFVLCAGAHPLQSVCDSVLHRMGPIVLKDEEVYKYVDAWTNLNYNDAVRDACDATGTAPSTFAMFGTKNGIGESVGGDQKFIINGKGEVDGIPGYDEENKEQDHVTIAPGGLQVAQGPSDDSIARKLYNTDEEGDIVILEPIVCGLFKSTIRNKSKYSKKSPFIAHDRDWTLRFNVYTKLLQSLFQIVTGSESTRANMSNFYSYLTIDIVDATLHVQYAKPLVPIPRHIKYSWPRFKVYSKTWTYSGSDQVVEWRNLRSGSVPDAMFICSRLRYEDDWYNEKHILATFGRSAYVKELKVRHSLSDRNIYYGDGDRSKTLLFHTRRNFKYHTVSPNHKHGQIVGISRADLSITQQALKSMKEDKSIEVGIKLKVAAKLDDLVVKVTQQPGITDGTYQFALGNMALNLKGNAHFAAGYSPVPIDNLPGYDGLPVAAQADFFISGKSDGNLFAVLKRYDPNYVGFDA